MASCPFRAFSQVEDKDKQIEKTVEYKKGYDMSQNRASNTDLDG